MELGFENVLCAQSNPNGILLTAGNDRTIKRLGIHELTCDFFLTHLRLIRDSFVACSWLVCDPFVQTIPIDILLMAGNDRTSTMLQHPRTHSWRSRHSFVISGAWMRFFNSASRLDYLPKYNQCAFWTHSWRIHQLICDKRCMNESLELCFTSRLLAQTSWVSVSNSAGCLDYLLKYHQWASSTPFDA